MPDRVILLHGIGRGAWSMAKMDSSLRAAGLTTLNLDYNSRHRTIEQLADDVAPAVERFSKAETPPHFVTHSMGGLVVRAFLARQPAGWSGKVVMLGPPNGGSELADRWHRLRMYRVFFGPAGQQLTTRACAAPLPAPIDYPLGIIAGDRSIPWLGGRLLAQPNDGKVSVASTTLSGMRDHITVPVSHAWLMRDATVIRETIHFLQTGRFQRTPGLDRARSRSGSPVTAG